MLFETCYHNFTDSSLYESEVRTCTVGRLDEYCGEVRRPRPTVNPLGGSGVRVGTPVGNYGCPWRYGRPPMCQL
jgi:hypothetical protein